MRLAKPMRLMSLISPPRPTKPPMKPTMIRQSTKVEEPTRLIIEADKTEAVEAADAANAAEANKTEAAEAVDADKAKEANEADKAKANEANIEAVNPTIHQS